MQFSKYVILNDISYNTVQIIVIIINSYIYIYIYKILIMFF